MSCIFLLKKTYCCHRNRGVAHWGGSEQPGHSLHHRWTVTLSTIWRWRHQSQFWSRPLSNLEPLWIWIHSRLGPHHLDWSSPLCGHRTSLSAGMMVLNLDTFLVALIRWVGGKSGRGLCVWWRFGSGAQCGFRLHARRYTQTLAFQCWWALSFWVILTVLRDGAELSIPQWKEQGLETDFQLYFSKDCNMQDSTWRLGVVHFSDVPFLFLLYPLASSLPCKMNKNGNLLTQTLVKFKVFT